MATHFSIVVSEIPWTEEPGGLQSMGLQSQTRLSNYTTTLTRLREWETKPVFSNDLAHVW